MSTANGLPQSFKGAIEFKKNILKRDLVLNRYTGNSRINPTYNNLILKDSNHFLSQFTLRLFDSTLNENRASRASQVNR